MYASWDGQNWQFQTVVPGGTVGDGHSLSLDHTGKPHIAYRDFGVGGGKLKYAAWDGSTWNFQTVDSQGDAGQNPSLAIDSADHPHISYKGGDYSLRYASWNGSGWQFQTVDARPGMYNLPNSLRLDSADRPHISYYDAYIVPSALKYAAWDGSAWQIETIDSYGAGLSNSLILDHNDKPHISYYVPIDGTGGGSLNYAAFGFGPSAYANPPGGQYTSAQSVVLSTVNGLGTIYYTTDGATPTTSSPRYMQFYPIYIEANKVTMLKFFTVDNRGTKGEVKTETYYIGVTPQLFTLTIANSNQTGGTVTSNTGGIDCGTVCSKSYASDTEVILTATPQIGHTFEGWTGDCTGTALTCTLSMNAAKSVGANFKANQTIIFGAAPSLLVGGIGTVSATGGASGSPVTFSSSTPAVCVSGGTNGSTVTGVAAGTCTIAANQAGNAIYNDAPQLTQTFSIGKANQTIIFGVAPSLLVGGIGTVSATGGASGNPVTFSSTTTAVCASGGTNGSSVSGVEAGTCTIAANQVGNANYNSALQVTQSFAVSIAADFTLTINNLNLLGGTITSNTGGINCGTVCSKSYANGTVVTLQASPRDDFMFSGWGGGCSGYANTCTLTMAAEKTVTANFDVFKKKRSPSWRAWLLSQ